MIVDELKLYKVYLHYSSSQIILQLYWASTPKHVKELMGWKESDRPVPVIEEVQVREGCVLHHHILKSKY